MGRYFKLTHYQNYTELCTGVDQKKIPHPGPLGPW